MKIFILEDDPGRMGWFRFRLYLHDITHAESCTEIARFMPPYDLVFLDHDLGGRQLEDHEDNGCTFAKMIAGHVDPKTVIIHSYSFDGARNIQSVLGGGWIAPFRGPTFNQLINALVGGKTPIYD